MPVFDQLSEPPRKGKVISSAFDSEIFDADGTIHVPGLVSSATISPSGRDVALASPEGLAIIDLDSPYSAPRRLSSHGLPWLVVEVQWSPFAARDYWVASTANHRCLVWNLNLRDDSPSGAIEHSLQGHSRAITDINFSAHHPDLLATCAVDGYVHCWDLRRPRQPAFTFCDWFAGATQVKYNRQDGHILASSHDRWLHVWDDRKAAEPLKSISAHTSKIYGIDWNRTRATAVVTCSLDKSIKLWDYNNEDDVPERVIRTDFPVWRARHTPFGWGLLAMPQHEPGHLYLYDSRPEEEAHVPADGPADPVAVFPGHGNHKVKEFLWRSRGGIGEDGVDTREFQLVSWGEDNHLRLDKMDAPVLESVGHFRGRQARGNWNITRRGAIYKTFRTVDDSVHRNRRNATMSDPRGGVKSGSGSTRYRRSTLSWGMHASHGRGTASGHWRGLSKNKILSHKDADRSQLQIGWMKGITLARRKASSAAPGRAGDSGSLFGPGGYHADEWAEPETIQEEFVRISNQLPNVNWEGIDMDALVLNASLQGPWGVDGESIFIKAQVDVPAGYPKTEAPRIEIEKTLLMPDATHDKMEREVGLIASRFLERRENCLDVVFTYLLGEVDLESSIVFLNKNGRGGLAGADGLGEDESSSEEEGDDDNDSDDIPAGGSASMSQELTPSAELDQSGSHAGILAPTQRLPMPPPPRLCGARFSSDGRLVCFFPTTREQKARVLLSSAASPDAYRGDATATTTTTARGEPSFAGFGRLAQDSPPQRHAHYGDEASATEEQSGSSDESDSSTSSSDSGLTGTHRINHLWHQPGLRFRKAWSADESVRSSGGGGTNTLTGTATATSRKRPPGRPKNVVSVHDVRELLPSKQQYAREYALFGDGRDVCEHNARVAERHGDADLVDIWRYAALLLRKGIPLERLHQQESILVIARAAVSDDNDDDDDTCLSGRVKWGHHPLAQAFVDDLLDYFEKTADVQMLAMLSCIFGDSTADDGAAFVSSRLTQPETPLPMKAPSFSLEYFPTDPAFANNHFKSQASSAITTPRTSHTPATYTDSQASEDNNNNNTNNNTWSAEPGSHSYSCGETPPKPQQQHLRDAPAAQSLSTSPENRLFRRSNPAVAAAFAASLPRALAGIVSGSPPDPPSRKRPSPAETSLGGNLAAPSGGVTWNTNNEPPGTSRTSMSDDEHYRRDEFAAMVPVAVSCVPENQGLFDDDGWLSTPLLPPARHAACAAYRYAYAEMLQMWRLPLARLEILKFNVIEDVAGCDSSASSHHELMSGLPDTNTANNASAGTTSPAMPLGGRREQLQALLASGRGLDVTGICRVHEIQLDPLEYARPTAGLVGGAVGTCQRCQHERSASSTVAPQTRLRCVVCAEPIDALYAACLGCGCASHEACLAAWHAAGEAECPAGDDCLCAVHACDGRVESWPALRAAVARAEGTGSRNGDKKKHAFRAGGSLRLRRTSVPARLGAYHAYDDDEDDDDDDGASTVRGSSNKSRGGGRNDDTTDWDGWETVSASAGLPSAASDKPTPQGDEPVSAARLSLGHRLKKSLGESARPSVLRRGSGGVTTWKRLG